MTQPVPPSPNQQPAFFTAAAQATGQRPVLQRQQEQNRVLACLGSSPSSQAIIAHAVGISKSLDLPVTIARVLDMPAPFGTPADPVDWQLRRRQGHDQLAHFAQSDATGPQVESVLLSGSPADELQRWAADHAVSLIVLGTKDSADRMHPGLGTTAQSMLSNAESSLLLVPSFAAERDQHGYRRLLVPLDGSARAESVLPVAIRIARAHRAELLLAHVVPPIEVVPPALLQPATRELRDRLEKRNDETARSYLERLRRGMVEEPFPTRAIVARDGDPRAELRRLAAAEAADLIVLASHGASGLADVPCGSVTEYLATHAPAPLLIVRSSFSVGFHRSGSGSSAPVAAALH